MVTRVHRTPLRDLVGLFARLGFTAFGGPAVHIAMMRDEVVRRRRWLSDQQFLDLLGAANLIPGPSSTELAIYIGYRQAGAAGLVAAGAAFILPATLIVLACAWAYVTYGALPAAGRVFYGVTPVLIAVIVQALWGLGRTALRDALTAGLAAAVFVLGLLDVNVTALLLGGGGVAVLVRRAGGGPRRRPLLAAVPIVPAAAAAGAPLTFLTLFVTFLKIGAVLFGSGYVLLAFLHGELVERLRWLTDRQLLDAVAVGQFTPGPVFTTATFIGYVLGGIPGAAVATLGIFLPSFVFVAATYPFITPLRQSPWTAAFLDGVNAAAVALMAAVTWHLGRAALVDGLTVAEAALALAVLVRFQVNSALLILAGGLLGLLAGR